MSFIKSMDDFASPGKFPSKADAPIATASAKKVIVL
jgi:hypothetical protein